MMVPAEQIRDVGEEVIASIVTILQEAIINEIV